MTSSPPAAPPPSGGTEPTQVQARPKRGGAVPPDPLSLTPRQSARRERIVEAGVSLLGVHHYEEIQVKDIAVAADVALGTVYRYFASKEHLFAEVLVRWAASLRTSLDRRPLKEGTAGDRLKEVLHRGIRGFQRQPQLARLVATLEMSTDPFAVEILQRLDRTTLEAYTQAIPDIPGEQAAGIIRVVNAVYGAALRSWSMGRAPIVQLYDRVDEAVDLLLEFSVAGSSGKPASKRRG